MKNSFKTNNFIKQLNFRNRLFLTKQLLYLSRNHDAVFSNQQILKKSPAGWSARMSGFFVKSFLRYLAVFKGKKTDHYKIFNAINGLKEPISVPNTNKTKTSPPLATHTYSRMLDLRFIFWKNRISYVSAPNSGLVLLLKNVRWLFFLFFALLLCAALFFFFQMLLLYSGLSAILAFYYIKRSIIFVWAHFGSFTPLFDILIDFFCPSELFKFQLIMPEQILTFVQILFKTWEDHMLSREFFYQIEFLPIYWLFACVFGIYAFLILAFGYITWKFLIYRYDFWAPTVRLFHSADYLRAVPDISEITQVFRKNTLKSMRQSDILFENNLLSLNQKRFIAEYNMSAGLGGFVGFIDFFPSYDVILSEHSSTTRRLSVFKRTSKFFKAFGRLKFKKKINMWGSARFLRSLSIRTNYFKTDSTALSNTTVPANLFTIPRYKPTLFKSALLTFLAFFMNVSYIGDFNVLWFREYIHFLFTNESLIDSTPVLGGSLDREGPLVGPGVPGSMVDWYHRELASVVLARTLEKPSRNSIKSLFNFGTHSLINDYSFWQLGNNFENKFNKFAMHDEEVMQEYEDDSNSFFDKTTLFKGKEFYDQYFDVESKFLEDDPEAPVPDKSEDFFFEDSFLHDDMEFINIEEDDEEELIEKIYEYSDPAQNTFLWGQEMLQRNEKGYLVSTDEEDIGDELYAEEDAEEEDFDSDEPEPKFFKWPDWQQIMEEIEPEITPFSLLEDPFNKPGAGQEDDYSDVTFGHPAPSLTSDYDDAVSYSRQALFSSFYEDISDFYWLSTSDCAYRNLAEYPTSRFFLTPGLRKGSEVSYSLKKRAVAGRFLYFFAPFVKQMLILSFDRVRLDFLFGAVVGFISVNCFSVLILSGFFFNSNLGIWHLTSVVALQCIFIFLILFIAASFLTKFGLKHFVLKIFNPVILWFVLISYTFLGFSVSNTPVQRSNSSLFYTQTFFKNNVSAPYFENYPVVPKPFFLFISVQKRVNSALPYYNFNRWFTNLIQCKLSLQHKPALFTTYSHFWDEELLVDVKPTYADCKPNLNYELSRVAYSRNTLIRFFGSLSPYLSKNYTSGFMFVNQVDVIDGKSSFFFKATHLSEHLYTNTFITKKNQNVFFKKVYSLTSSSGLVFEDTRRFFFKNRLVSLKKNKNPSTYSTNLSTQHLQNFNEAALFYNVLTKPTFKLLSVKADKDSTQPSSNFYGSKDDLLELNPLFSQHLSDVEGLSRSRKLWEKHFDFFSANLLGDNYALNSKTYVSFLRLVFGENFLLNTFTNRSQKPSFWGVEQTFLSADIDKLKSFKP